MAAGARVVAAKTGAALVVGETAGVVMVVDDQAAAVAASAEAAPVVCVEAARVRSAMALQQRSTAATVVEEARLVVGASAHCGHSARDAEPALRQARTQFHR